MSCVRLQRLFIAEMVSFTALPNNCNVDQVDPGWFAAAGRYYKYASSVSGTYAACQQHCVDLGGHLATFKTEEDIVLLNTIRGGLCSQHSKPEVPSCLSHIDSINVEMFAGLQMVGNVPNWADGTTDPVPASVTPTDDACAKLSFGGAFMFGSCDFVISRPLCQAPCPTGTGNLTEVYARSWDW